MACCSARRVAGRAWEGEVPPRSFPVQLLVVVGGAVAGGLGALLILALAPVSAWARRQRKRFLAAVSTSVKSSAGRLLDSPFLVPVTARCEVATRLSGRSMALGGFVFRYFWVLVFSAFVSALGAVAAVVVPLVV